MRIWHQSMIVLEDVPAYAETLNRRLAQILRADTEVVLHGYRPGSFAGKPPVPDINTNIGYRLHGLQFLASAINAEKDGFDAVVLANIGNPMISELRSVLNIPVIGYGETAFHMSRLYGRRFGLVFFNAQRREGWLEAIRAMGLQDAFAGLSPAGILYPDAARALKDPRERGPIIERVVRTIEKLVKDCAADVIIPGEMPLTLLLSEEKVSSIAGATVLDGLAVTFKMAEMMVDLQKSSGMLQSRRGYFNEMPDVGRIREILSFYGLDRIGERS